MIDAAIIGLGWWGRYLVESLQGKSDRIRFARAIDVNAAMSQEFCKQHSLQFGTDIDVALNDSIIEAVVLTTPHSLHEDQIIRAAKAGKHVFCEKPLALSREGAIRAIAACEESHLVLGVGHERRFEPALVEIKNLIDTGRLGRIVHMEANFSHDGLAGVGADNWRTSKVESPAAAMTSMGIHLSDTFIHMLGPIAEVHALTTSGMTAFDSGDTVSVQLRFEKSATGSFSSILNTPFFMRVHVFGSDGWVEARDSVRPEQEGITKIAIRLSGGDVQNRDIKSIDTARANIEAFASCIEDRVPYPISTDEMVHNIAVLEAIVISAQSGKPVAVQ